MYKKNFRKCALFYGTIVIVMFSKMNCVLYMVSSKLNWYIDAMSNHHHHRLRPLAQSSLMIISKKNGSTQFYDSIAIRPNWNYMVNGRVLNKMGVKYFYMISYSMERERILLFHWNHFTDNEDVVRMSKDTWVSSLWPFSLFFYSNLLSLFSVTLCLYISSCPFDTVDVAHDNRPRSVITKIKRKM